METAHAHSKPLPAPCSVLYTQNNTFALTAVTAAEFQMGRAQRFTLARGHTTPWQGRNFSFEPTRSTTVFLPSASPVTLPAATAMSCLLPSRSPAVAPAERCGSRRFPVHSLLLGRRLGYGPSSPRRSSPFTDLSAPTPPCLSPCPWTRSVPDTSAACSAPRVGSSACSLDRNPPNGPDSVRDAGCHPRACDLQVAWPFL